MPSPEWKEKKELHDSEECWEIITKKINKPASRPMSVYVHVPFCDRRCNFCDCHSTFIAKNHPEKLTDYTGLLLSEINLWTMAPNISKRVTNKQIYLK